MASPNSEVLVYGAGAIGLYIGARLAASGVRVHFVGRAPIVERITGSGLDLVDLVGKRTHLAAGEVGASTALEGTASVDLVLLTVKGPATEQAAQDLARHLAPGTPLISFQNGIDNVARIRQHAPELDVAAGMVPFNVVFEESGAVRQATQGDLGCADTAFSRRWEARFADAGLPLRRHADMRAVQWGKLLLNLNNPINALAGIPLREQLLDSGYRRILADLQDEALVALNAAGIRPARVTPLPTSWLPRLLRLPTPLFRAIAQRMLKIAPQARSSMYDDRVAGRSTEIGDLCGAVVRLAADNSVQAPINQRLLRLVEEVPAGRFYRADELREALSG